MDNQWLLSMVVLGIVLLGWTGRSYAEDALAMKKDTGYRGIWYYNQETGDEYVYKYSGGLGTYCAKHLPMAVYAPEVDRTFFVYGGTLPTKPQVLEMVSYYDHKTGEVPRPTILFDKETSDAHDNPVISLDGEGYVWIFVSAHGKARPAYIFKSKKPYDIDDFELALETNFSYPQPWYFPGRGFLFLHTSYDGGRFLHQQTSPDGLEWSPRRRLAHIEHGHYQVSWRWNDKVGTAFNYHPDGFQGDPEKKGLNWRTNLYYMETEDMGETWRTAGGAPIDLPLASVENEALAVEYESQGLLAYMKDINFDREGRPLILHVTSKSWAPGPEHGPHEWRIAQWTGEEWILHVITASDNNYDTGCLHVDKDGTWRVIGPTEPGPQRFNPGGEIAIWTSKNEGATWVKRRQLTRGSLFNHTYCRRPVNAQADFFALWADGHGRRPSESRLYFCDRTGRRVFRLPYTMDEDSVKPERVRAKPGAKTPENTW